MRVAVCVCECVSLCVYTYLSAFGAAELSQELLMPALYLCLLMSLQGFSLHTLSLSPYLSLLLLPLLLSLSLSFSLYLIHLALL